MPQSTDRLLLALDLLQGDRDARLILADVLDDEGDRALADWARFGSMKRHRTLDFVLAVLPHRLTLRLACDYFASSLSRLEEHKISGFMNHESYQPTLQPLITAVQYGSQWARGKIDDDTFHEHRNTIASVGPWAHGIRDLDLSMQSLHMALTYTEIAESELRSDVAFALHEARQSRDASRKVAKASREILRPMLATRARMRLNPPLNRALQRLDANDILSEQFTKAQQAIEAEVPERT